MAVQPKEAARPLTVLELNTRIHDALATRFQTVLVKGEVAGVSLRSGHIWFTLKDQHASVNAVVFSSTARRLPFLPQNGQELLVSCQVDYHALYGRLTLVVNRLDYDGLGKLKEAIEQLKRKLEAEGAFRPERKRRLPFLPRCIALITSPSGAVIHDLQETIWERFPNTRLLLYPAQVQGTASQRSLVAALKQCAHDRIADVCIVARGGGSLEELMAFNQEAVVRAVQGMPIPVITALGHTSDRTVSDMVADREARTPTAAAELVVPKKADLLKQLHDRGERLRRAGSVALLPRAHELSRRGEQLRRMALLITSSRREGLGRQRIQLREREPHRIVVQRQRALSECGARLDRVVRNLVASTGERRARIERIAVDLQAAIRRRLDDEKRGLDERGRRLRTLGPQETLERGYSICLDSENDRVLRESGDTAPGRSLRVILGRGKLECRVEAADG